VTSLPLLSLYFTCLDDNCIAGRIFCTNCTPFRVSITLYGDICRVCEQCERRVRALGLLTVADEDVKESEPSGSSSESTNVTVTPIGTATTNSVSPLRHSIGGGGTPGRTPGAPTTPLKSLPRTPRRNTTPHATAHRPLPSQVAALRNLKFDEEKKMDEKVSQLSQTTRDELLKQLTILRDCLLQSGDAEGAADVGGIEIRVRSKDPSLMLADVKAVQLRVIDKILEGGLGDVPKLDEL